MWVAFGAASLAMAGCGASSQDKPGAVVQFANLSPDAETVSIRFNGTPIGRLTDAGTSTMPTLTASRRIEFNRNLPITYEGIGNDGTSYFVLGPMWYDKLSYQVRLMGKVRPAAGEPSLVADRLQVNDTVVAGKAGVRLVHAAPGLGAVDLLWEVTPTSGNTTTTTLVAGLTYGTTSQLQDGISSLLPVDPAKGDLVVVANGTTAALTRQTVTFTAAQVANLAVTGAASGVGLVQW